MQIKNIKEIPYMEFPTGRRTYVMIGENGAVKGSHFCQGFVDIKPGGSIPTNEHEPVESYIVLSGSGEIEVGSERREIKEGDYVFIESLVPHALYNTGNENLKIMFVYSPQIVVDHWAKELGKDA